MSRSIRKGPFVHPKLLKKVDSQNESGTKNPMKTWSRASVILPEFVGHTFEVHNGRAFIKGRDWWRKKTITSARVVAAKATEMKKSAAEAVAASEAAKRGPLHNFFKPLPA